MEGSGLPELQQGRYTQRCRGGSDTDRTRAEHGSGGISWLGLSKISKLQYLFDTCNLKRIQHCQQSFPGGFILHKLVKCRILFYCLICCNSFPLWYWIFFLIISNIEILVSWRSASEALVTIPQSQKWRLQIASFVQPKAQRLFIYCHKR